MKLCLNPAIMRGLSTWQRLTMLDENRPNLMSWTLVYPLNSFSAAPVSRRIRVSFDNSWCPHSLQLYVPT